MAAMGDAHNILWSILLFVNVSVGTYPGASATVIIGIGNATALFECKTAVTLRCHAGFSFARWQIAYRLETNTNFSAQCYANQCNVQNNFTGRYTFKYSSSTGIADLQIDPVNIEDDEREYKCSGNQQPLKATVKVFPTNSSYALLNATSEKSNDINFTLRLGCTTDNVNITWYFTKENGKEEEINPTYIVRNVCQDDECTNSNKSVNISSMLELEKVQAQGQAFSVNISYDLHTFHIPVQGSYKLKEISHIETQVSDGMKLVIKILLSVFGVMAFLIGLLILLVCCKDTIYRYCSKRGHSCCKFRVPVVPACIGDTDFKSNTTMPFSYKNKENLEKCDRDLMADENQNRSCTINNLQRSTKCNPKMKASDSLNQRVENVVHDVPVCIKPMGLRTEPRETSITCYWDKEFASTTVLQISYTNTETVKTDVRVLTSYEKQNRSCTINNLQPSTKYSLVMKAGGSYNLTAENVRTLALKPPNWFKLLSIEDHKITVAWEPASSDNNLSFRLTFYKVLHYKEKKQTEEFVEYKKPLMKKTVFGLEKNTKYKFEILTFIGKKTSIPLVGYTRTKGNKDATQMQHKGPKLITSERHLTEQHFV